MDALVAQADSVMRRLFDADSSPESLTPEEGVGILFAAIFVLKEIGYEDWRIRDLTKALIETCNDADKMAERRSKS